MSKMVIGPGATRPRSIEFLAGLTVIGLVAAFVLSTATLEPALGSTGMTKVGFFPRPTGQGAIGASGNIILNPDTRRGYQVSRLDTTFISEFDLDTLSVLRKREMPKISEAAAERSTDWFWSLDAVNNRLVFLVDDYAGSFETKKLSVMDLTTLEATEPILLWKDGDSVPLSFSYHAPSQRIYMIVRHQIDALGIGLRVEERSIGGKLIGFHPLPKCAGALDSQYQATTVRSLIQPSLIYLNCYGSNRVQNQIVRIDLGENSLLNEQDGEQVIPAVPGPLSTIFDPGSDRMFFLTANKGAGRGAWVFDGLRNSFLGVIATGDTEGGRDYSIGLDETTGRIYMHTPAGFVVADGRRTPLPGRLIFKDLRGTGFGRIQVDPMTHRVFVADVQGLTLPTRYAVLKDELPVSADPKAGDPDSLTSDIDEKEGVTDVNLSASARAFAVRSLTTGGAQRAGWNVSMGSLIGPEDRPELAKLFADIPLDAGNRDLYLARVQEVNLSGKDTEARATFADADDATESDLRTANQVWPYPSIDCADSGGSAQSTVDARSLSGAWCDSDSATVRASSGGGSAFADGPFGIQALASSGHVFRDKDLGLVSVSEALVSGISIAKVVHIGELRTSAMTWAKGRKGAAGALFERRLGDVSVDTDRDGKIDFRCGGSARGGTGECDMSMATSAIAKALEGKAAVMFPDPDPTFSGGSPGGYQAVIQKNRFQSYSERSLNDDDSPEVVGMQIVYYADAKAGRSRQVIQLAGVQAESHYGIYRLPNSSAGSTDLGSFIEGTTNPLFELAPSIQGGEIAAAAPVLGVSKASFDKVIEKIAAGWRFLLANTSDAIKLAALWSLFLLPLYLIGRRRFITL